jgi:hypothetical protein
MLGRSDLRDGIATGSGIRKDEGGQHGGGLCSRDLKLHTRLNDQRLKGKDE